MVIRSLVIVCDDVWSQSPLIAELSLPLRFGRWMSVVTSAARRLLLLLRTDTSDTAWGEDGGRRKVGSSVSCSSSAPLVCVVWEHSVTYCCRPTILLLLLQLLLLLLCRAHSSSSYNGPPLSKCRPTLPGAKLPWTTERERECEWVGTVGATHPTTGRLTVHPH